jgi:aarF domain-containing kinase
MNHSMPKEITDTLAKLQDQANPQEFKYVRNVIQQDLGEVFEEIEQVPIGAASLAQVHKAKVKGNGRWVAVKVQYPNLDQLVHGDLSTMEWIAFAAGKAFLKSDFTWIFSEFKKSLLTELDFEEEGKRAERAARNLKGDSHFYVPEILWKYTSKRILTMEFIDGCKISEIEKIKAMKFNPKDVAKKVIEMFSSMIYVHGYVHCDP